MCLYGQDMDETTSLVEAGLGWIVSLDEAKGDFPGRAVLAGQKKHGAPRKLVGFEVTGRGIARHGYPVLVHDERIGEVTSGTYAPFLQKNIGLCYVPATRAAVGTELAIDIRERKVPARVVPTPFYKRPDKAAPAPATTVSTDLRSTMDPANLKYTKDHEWVRVEGDHGAIGITDYAQKQLGDVVYVELPEVGREAEGARDLRDGGVREGRLRAVLARGGRGGGGQRRPRAIAGGAQRRSLRQGLDDQGAAGRCQGRRRPSWTPAPTRNTWRARRNSPLMTTRSVPVPAARGAQPHRHIPAPPHRPRRGRGHGDAARRSATLARGAHRRHRAGGDPPAPRPAPARAARRARADRRPARDGRPRTRSSARSSAWGITTASRRPSSSGTSWRTRAGTRSTRPTRRRSRKAGWKRS